MGLSARTEVAGPRAPMANVTNMTTTLSKMGKVTAAIPMYTNTNVSAMSAITLYAFCVRYAARGEKLCSVNTAMTMPQKRMVTIPESDIASAVKYAAHGNANESAASMIRSSSWWRMSSHLNTRDEQMP